MNSLSPCCSEKKKKIERPTGIWKLKISHMIHEKSLKLTFLVLHYCHACLVTTGRHKCPSPAEHMGPENGPVTTKIT